MPRQRHRFGRSQTPSIDECPLNLTLAHQISNASPPPIRGFATPGPASDAPSLPRPVKGRGLDLAAFVSSSLSCARGHASFVDFCQRDDPQARPSDVRYLAPIASPRLSPRRRSLSAGPRWCPLASPFDRSSSRTAEPRSLGSGAFLYRVRARALARQAPSSRDGSQWRLRPNPMWLGHLVSRDRSPPGWSRRGDARSANEPADISRVRPARPLARSVERAASRTSPRREDAIRCTRGAFRPEIPLAGGLNIHRLSPTCGG